MKKRLTFFLTSLFILTEIMGQYNTLHLENPSFEFQNTSESSLAEIPFGFEQCNLEEVTPKNQNGKPLFVANHPPSDGDSFLKLTAHSDGKWDRVSTRLSASMKKGQQYVFHLNLSRERNSAASQIRAPYLTACKLRIWAGNSPCNREELLTESAPIVHHYWQDYAFVLSPNESYSHLIFEVFYETSFPFPYEGNILLDYASSLRMLPKSDGEDRVRVGTPLRLFEYQDSVFGEIANLSFYGRDEELSDQLAKEVFERGNEVQSGLERGLVTLADAEWNRFTPNEDFREILAFAIGANKNTKGYFDIGRQKELKSQWVVCTEQLERRPKKEELMSILDKTGIRRIAMKNDSIFWVKTINVNLEWEELAKAHAVDEMGEIFSKNGDLMFSIKLGDKALSNMSEQFYDRPYFEADTLLISQVQLSHSAIASSQAGDLLFEFEGEKFYDFIEPMRGRPVRERRAVTVEARDCKTAYAWSQAFVGSMDMELVEAAGQYIFRKWVSTE